MHSLKSDRIRIALDNLSTHTRAALFTALPAWNARRILHRIEFHFTPMHVCLLNMVEIEIGDLQRNRLGQRIPGRKTPEAGTIAWEQQRNESHACII